MIEFTQDQLNRIQEIAAREYPHECCGVLIGRTQGQRKSVTDLRVAENERYDSLRNRYLIDAGVIYRIESELLGTGQAIIGFFHSHPDAPARPSLYDQEHAWPWYSYLIVSVIQGNPSDTRVWQLKEDRSGFTEEAFEVSTVEVN
ncbi:MAG TPA: M67 family metallopeptidase [Acidobacteriota bacterium]|nr:M67 family metallopeptidase [Acidobacteriota bacterium]